MKRITGIYMTFNKGLRIVKKTFDLLKSIYLLNVTEK